MQPTRKKELSIGPFDENMDKTDVLVILAREHLPELESLLVGTPYFWGDELSLDDFHVFASLRCLTTCGEINFPPKIDKYMNTLSEICKVPLHWEKSL